MNESLNNIIDSFVIGDTISSMKTIPDKSIDLILTSPPYFDILKYDKELSYKTIEEYYKWTNEYIEEYKRIIKEDGFVIFNIGLKVTFKDIEHLPFKCMEIFQKNQFKLVNEIIWEKPKGDQGLWTMAMTRWLKKKTDQPIFAKQHEYIHIYNLGNRKKLNNTHTEEFIKKVCWSVWKHRVSRQKGHPCAFPKDMISDLILCYSNENDLVLDNFCGTGTTCLSAKINNRKFIGIEQSEEYIKIAKDRIKEISENQIFK